jgi:hypothetical protein
LVVSREAYGVIFSRVGWFGVLFALSVHLITQGGAAVINLPGLDTRMPNISAYFAIPIIGLALAITATAGALHALQPRQPGEPCLPLAGLGDAAPTVDAGRCSAKVYVVVIFAVLIVLPAVTLGHLNRVVITRAVVWSAEQNDPDPIMVRPACMMPWPWSWFCPADERALVPGSRDNGQQRLWLADNRCDPRMSRWSEGMDPPCDQPSLTCVEHPERCRGVDWPPWISPLAIILPTLLGWGGTVFCIFALIRCARARKEVNA